MFELKVYCCHNDKKSVVHSFYATRKYAQRVAIRHLRRLSSYNYGAYVKNTITEELISAVLIPTKSLSWGWMNTAPIEKNYFQNMTGDVHNDILNEIFNKWSTLREYMRYLIYCSHL